MTVPAASSMTADLGETGRSGQRLELTPGRGACGLRFVPRVPALFFDAMFPLLDLEPRERAAARVIRRLVFGDEALVATLQHRLHLVPRLAALDHWSGRHSTAPK